VGHILVEIANSDASASAARRAAEQLLPIGNGVLLALVAEPGKTRVKYANPESLIWRDAGVVLGYMSIVAEALHLAFCPLGITGHQYVKDLVPERVGDIWGASLAILGGSLI
jgi:hypothetical protein